MSKSTLPRLKALRDEMGKAGITAFIIPEPMEAFMCSRLPLICFRISP